MTHRLAALLLVPLSYSAAQAAPGWCQGEPFAVQGALVDLYSEPDPFTALLNLVAASCFPDDEARTQAKPIELVRKGWSKKLDLTEADWTDVAAWAAAPREERNAMEVSARAKLAWSAHGPIDQYAAITRSMRGASDLATDPAYVADAFGAALSQTGRMAYVQLCLDGDAATAPVRWAMCQADVAAFDPAAVLVELRADTGHTAVERMTLRLAVHALRPRLAEHAAAVQALLATDPAYPQMFALASSAQHDPTDPVLAGAMLALDDARVTGSRAASAGCGARTWKAWQDVVGKVPAKTFAGRKTTDWWTLFPSAMALVTTDRDGYLAALALEQCAVLDGHQDYLARTLGELMVRWPGVRGPRTAAQTAILTAGLVLDDRAAHVEYPEVSRPWIDRQTGSDGGAMGVVAAIAVDGERAVVTFKKQKVKQTRCTKGHYTDRIEQITSGGTIVYRYECTAELTETIEVAPSPPLTVNARYVDGLRVGMYVSILEDVVTIAYPKGKAAVPAMVAGVVVK